MPKEPSQLPSHRRQLVMLAKAFKTEPNPSKTSLAKLAKSIQLPLSQVMTWFENRRCLESLAVQPDGGVVEPPAPAPVVIKPVVQSSGVPAVSVPDDAAALALSALAPSASSAASSNPPTSMPESPKFEDELRGDLTLEDVDALMNEDDSEDDMVRAVYNALRTTDLASCMMTLADNRAANDEMAYLEVANQERHLELIQNALVMQTEHKLDAKNALMCAYVRALTADKPSESQ